MNNIHVLFDKAISNRLIKKAIFSKPSDLDLLRAEARLFRKDDSVMVQVASYRRDGKNLHRNIAETDAAAELTRMCGNFAQCNILTDGHGEGQVMVSKKGKVTVLDKLTLSGETPEVASHDRDKSNFLRSGVYYPFLYELGISDQTGRIFDRKADKFRQINNFLRIVDDALNGLPAKSKLRVVDLCCGKSYLTFALWYYLNHIRNTPAMILGMDLKSDVISSCNDIAAKLGCDGMSFVCGDVASCSPESAPDIVVSLHACDTATDIVLANALKWGSKVILAAPCCQHELYSQMEHSRGDTLGAVGEYGLLKARYAALLTDALRGRLLEAQGYQVDMLEFCDPDDTPKNLLIRAVRGSGISSEKRTAILAQCREECARLGVAPSLMDMLGLSGR